MLYLGEKWSYVGNVLKSAYFQLMFSSQVHYFGAYLLIFVRKIVVHYTQLLQSIYGIVYLKQDR